jgi:hypothetical protein
LSCEIGYDLVACENFVPVGGDDGDCLCGVEGAAAADSDYAVRLFLPGESGALLDGVVRAVRFYYLN